MQYHNNFSKLSQVHTDLEGPIQMLLHSCAEPNSIKFNLRATLERQLIDAPYFGQTKLKSLHV